MHPVDYYSSTTADLASNEDVASYIPEEWNTWDSGKRLDELNKIMAWGVCHGGSKSNLRELRSPLIEAWLAAPEPPPRKQHKISSQKKQNTETD